jgi:hypothetical protein
MRRKEIVLAAAIVLSALPASAASKHHRVTHTYNYVHRPIYNMVMPGTFGGGCPANGGPGCSTEGQSAPLDRW